MRFKFFSLPTGSTFAVILAAAAAALEVTAAALTGAAVYRTTTTITGNHQNNNNNVNKNRNNSNKPNSNNSNYYYNNNNDSSSSFTDDDGKEFQHNSALIVTMEELNNNINRNSTFILAATTTTAISLMAALTTKNAPTTTNLSSTRPLTTTTSIKATTLTATKMKEKNNENVISMSTNIGDGDMDEDVDLESVSDYVPPLQRPETYIITTLFTLIFIVGVLGNGTLVIIFFRHRSMRNIPNTYILSLALADLLVIIVCVPMATSVYTLESWTLGVDLCRISEFFKDISIGVSVFTLTALSGERYCAIVNPLRKLQTKPLTVFTASMIWLLAILLGLPSFIVSDINEVHMPNNLTILVCTPFGKNGTNTETYAKYTVVSKACIYYLLPLLIIGALYILMAKRLHLSARDMPGEALGMQSRSQARARRHVARMVVAFVVIFFACFFPYHVFELWFHLNPTAYDDFDDFWHAVRMIGFCTSFLHSCVNPVTLYCISGVFRQHFNRYLCCLFVKKQPRLRQHSTATAMIDTSIISIRRSNTTSHHYNRGSLYINSSALAAAGGGGGAGGGGLQRSSICANNNINANGNNANTNILDVSNGSSSGGVNAGSGSGTLARHNKSGISPAQSIILSDKR